MTCRKIFRLSYWQCPSASSSSGVEESYDKVLRNVPKDTNLNVLLLCLARYQWLGWSLWLYSPTCSWPQTSNLCQSLAFQNYVPLCLRETCDWWKVWQKMLSNPVQISRVRVLVAKIRPNSYDAFCRSDPSCSWVTEPWGEAVDSLIPCRGQSWAFSLNWSLFITHTHTHALFL